MREHLEPRSADAGRPSGRVESSGAFEQLRTAIGGEFASDSLKGTPKANSKRLPYLTPERLAALAASLSARDEAVIRTLRLVRLATASQLARLELVGLTPRRQRGVLASLTERQFIARLPRVVGGVRAGSAGYVYSLGPAGVRLLADPDARRRRPPHYGQLFLAHSLAVTELYVGLREADQAGELRLRSFSTEPATWRRFPGPSGQANILKPDAEVRVQLGDYEDSWFIEVDRATESTTTVARACDRYRAYWQTGREQARTDVFPKVLWLVPDKHRYDQLVTVLGKQPAAAWDLFEVALQADAVKRLSTGVAS